MALDPAKIREQLAGLSPEQQNQFLDELEKRQAALKATEAPKGSAAGRYLGAVAENLIPEAIRHPSMLAQVPGALKDVVQRQVQEGDPTALALPGLRPTVQAAAEAIGTSSAASYKHQRDQGTNIVSSALAATPIIGPAAAQAGEEIGQGNYAEGFGHAAGMLAPFALRPAANLTRTAVPAAVEAVQRTAAAYPRVTNAAIGAVPGLLHGNLPLAASGALAGVKLGSIKAVLEAALKPDAALSAKLAHTLAKADPGAVAAWTETQQRAAMQVAGAHERALKMAAKMAPQGSSLAPGASKAAQALESAGLSPELATAEAGKMAASTGEVSGNLPGVLTPAGGTTAVKMPAVSLAEDIQAQVATLRASGLSQAQISAAVRETHGLEAGAAKKVVETIFEHGGGRVAATAEALPAGRKLAPPYRGGKAQPYLGPARVPANDADLESLLKQSLKAYEIP